MLVRRRTGGSQFTTLPSIPSPRCLSTVAVQVEEAPNYKINPGHHEHRQDLGIRATIRGIRAQREEATTERRVACGIEGEQGGGRKL